VALKFGPCLRFWEAKVHKQGQTDQIAQAGGDINRPNDLLAAGGIKRLPARDGPDDQKAFRKS